MNRTLIGARDIGFPLWEMHANGNQEERNAAKRIYEMLRESDSNAESDAERNASLISVLDFLNKCSGDRSIKENLGVYVTLDKIEKAITI